MVFIGLGNPGQRYAMTRHNAGFMVIDRLARKFSVKMTKPLFRPLRIGTLQYAGRTVYLVQPLTFMNHSGEVIPWILKKTGCTLQDLVLIVDNLDLPPGSLRMKIKGSSGGQRGLESVIRVLGTDAFPRLFLGIGRPDKHTDVVSHVLGEFSSCEADLFNNAVDNAVDALLGIIKEPIDKVIHHVNRRSPA